MMAATDVKARKILDLSRQVRAIGDTPRKADSGEHAAAQSNMAALGYELAGLFLNALAGASDTPLDKLRVAKSLAMDVMANYPEEAHGSAWLEQAVGLMGRCESEIEAIEEG